MLKLKLQSLATWCEELTHLKRPWCWEWLKAGGEGDDRGWDGWSPTQWTWVWASSRSWWWTGKPGVLQSMGLHKVGHDWQTELNIKMFINSFMITKTCIYFWLYSEFPLLCWSKKQHCKPDDNPAWFLLKRLKSSFQLVTQWVFFFFFFFL